MWTKKTQIVRQFGAAVVICSALILAAACSGAPGSTSPGRATSVSAGTPAAGAFEATPGLLPSAGAGAQAPAAASPAATSLPTAAPTATTLPTSTGTAQTAEPPTANPAPRPTDTPQPAAPAQQPAAPAQPQPAAPAGQAPGQASSPQEAFIQSIVPYAQAEQADSGVPASFSVALAAAETGWGASPLMKQHNVYHALGCSQPNEGLPCVSYGGGMWNAYSSPLQAFLWHGRWLRAHSEFAEAFKHTDDVAAFTRLVAQCYVSCAGPFPQAFYDGTIKIINQYNLTQYDKPAASTKSSHYAWTRSSTYVDS